MHPVARVFQYLFLAVGLLLLPIGFMLQAQPIDQHANFAWECTTVSAPGKDPKQSCGLSPDNAELSLYDGENTGLTCSLAGVGLLVASVSVAVGGSRGASGTAAYGAPASVPGQPVQPHPQPAQSQPPQPQAAPPGHPQPPAQGPGAGPSGGGY